MLKIVCSKCNFILYVGISYNNEKLITPNDIIAQNEGKCPKCGKILAYNPKRFNK